jgi:predicted peptidase
LVLRTKLTLLASAVRLSLFVLVAGCEIVSDQPDAIATDTQADDTPPSDSSIHQALPAEEIVADSVVESGIEEPLDDTVGVLLPRRFGEARSAAEVQDFWLYLPPGIGRGQRWPVLLYLHGRSLRGSELDRLKSYGIPALLARGEHLPFIVVAPQLPAGQRWTDTQQVVSVLEDALRPLPVDRDRIYVTGYSMGAGGAWRMVIAHPSLFAAAVLVAATTPDPTDAVTAALARMPIRVYHGSADGDASYADAYAMVRALQAHGAPAELVSLEGEGHDIVNQVYQDSALYRWLLSHRRTGHSNGS